MKGQPCVEGTEEALELLNEYLDVFDITSVVFRSGNGDLLVDPVDHLVSLAQELVQLHSPNSTIN